MEKIWYGMTYRNIFFVSFLYKTKMNISAKGN